jgi:hypothetical protein
MSFLTKRRTSPRNTNEDAFPAAQLFLLALVRVAEPIALTSILPYAWKLVLDFQVSSESNAPFFAGLLISAFSLVSNDKPQTSKANMWYRRKHVVVWLGAPYQTASAVNLLSS